MNMKLDILLSFSNKLYHLLCAKRIKAFRKLIVNKIMIEWTLKRLARFQSFIVSICRILNDRQTTGIIAPEINTGRGHTCIERWVQKVCLSDI